MPPRIIKRWAWHVHRWTGISLCLYVAVVCATGSILVYKDALERRTGRGYLAPRAGSVQTHSWQELYDTVRRAYPNAEFTHLAFPEHEGEAPYFRIVQGTGRVYVFVDPYTNTILGHDDSTNGITAFVYDLHVNLLIGGGRTVNGAAGVAVLVLLTTGVIVWWPAAANWRSRFRCDVRAPWRRQIYDVHGIAGIVMSVPWIVICLTGVCLVFPAPFRWVAATLSPAGAWFETPRVDRVEVSSPGLDELVADARKAMPDGAARLFRFAANPRAAAYLRLDLPGDWSESGSNFIYVDQYSGRVLKRDIHNELPPAVRLIRNNAAIHFGSFGRDWSRLLWAVAGVAGLVASLTGAVLFLGPPPDSLSPRARLVGTP